MVALLPRLVDGLAGFEQGLTAAKLRIWIRKLRSGEVVVYFPKFKTSSEIRLDANLKALGMLDAFGAKADLAGMFENQGPFMSAAIHKACVDVNEQGTEAAVLTAFHMYIGATPTFRADHPFLFLIRDRRTGCVLFLGRVVNPLQSGSE